MAKTAYKLIVPEGYSGEIKGLNYRCGDCKGTISEADLESHAVAHRSNSYSVDLTMDNAKRRH